MVEMNVSFVSITPQAFQHKFEKTKIKTQRLPNLQGSMKKHILQANIKQLFTPPTQFTSNITAVYWKSTIQAADWLGNPFLVYFQFENVKHFSVNCQQVRITRWKMRKKEVKKEAIVGIIYPHVLSCGDVPPSHSQTLSLWECRAAAASEAAVETS